MSSLTKPTKVNETVAWRGDIPISSRYTAGVAGERFFREIKDNARFLGTRCSHCDMTFVPATMFCERCFAHLDEWREVSSVGTIFSYTILHVDLDEGRLPEPRILAYIKLDESDGGLVHFLSNVQPQDVDFGLRVKAVFRPPEEREGSIRDVRFFEPFPG